MNKYKWFSKVLVLVFFLSANNLFSQSDDSDLESWTSLGIKYKLNKKWSFDLEEQLRLKENISEIDEYFTEVNAKYAISKSVKIGGGARFIKENDNNGAIQGYEDKFRFHFDLTYKHLLKKKLSVKYRLRYQNKNELGISKENGDFASEHFRIKTTFLYDFKKWKLDPKVAAEIYYNVTENEENEFSKYRLTLGTDYNIKEIGALSIFYRIDKQLNILNPKTRNIIGLKFVYELKTKKNS